MVDLNFKIKGQKLQLLNRSCKIVNKTNDYVKLKFTFNGTDWDNTTRYTIINDSKDKSYIFTIHDENPTITLPSKLVDGDYFIVGVYGVTEDNIRVTTNVYEIRLSHSNYTLDLTPVEYESKDVFAEIYDKLNEKLNKSEYVVDDVISGTSTNPVQNRVIKEALQNLTPSNLARVAYTGNYQDLDNKRHSHISDDVSDLENTISDDVDLFCRLLSDKIRM